MTFDLRNWLVENYISSWAHIYSDRSTFTRLKNVSILSKWYLRTMISPTMLGFYASIPASSSRGSMHQIIGGKSYLFFSGVSLLKCWNLSLRPITALITMFKFCEVRIGSRDPELTSGWRRIECSMPLYMNTYQIQHPANTNSDRSWHDV